MPAVQRSRSRRTAIILRVAVAALATGPSRADTVTLKNGTVYRGTVDKDNTLVFVNDNLRRVIFYNSKIQKVESDPGFSNLERFALVQPLEVHGGTMPVAAVDIRSTPWDAKGRRSFRYVNARQRPVEMQQAINELGPHLTRFRGIDGFWTGQVATSQVPRPVVTGLLGKVDQANESERTKVTRWLLQAGWYPEVRQALDGLERDFPQLKLTVAEVRQTVAELEGREVLADVATRRKGQQPAGALSRLRALPTAGLPRDILDDARDQIRKDDDRAVADRLLADSLRDLAEKLSEVDRKGWKPRLAEVLEALARAPDAVRARLDALARADSSASPEARFALAMSGWVVGPDAAVDTLAAASALWDARRSVLKYLSGREDDPVADPALKDYEKTRKAPPPRPRIGPEKARADALVELTNLEAGSKVDHDALARIVARMAPPLAEEGERPSAVTIRRVGDDENPDPSEYAVLLPPEYHPLRSYPAVVALHDGRGPKSAIDWVAAEASRRGYIVVAPEYNLPGKGKGYRYSTSEHAAVELSLRDARKRYAIDSDRVFLAGQLAGADAAWDVGLAHPDLFAGVVAVSGFPAKYAYKYKVNADKVPLYVAIGEFAPAAREVVFDQYLKPMIENVQDVTYVDYLKRGLEELPEEVPSFFDWTDRRHRDPAPRTFDAATARDGDARFFGVVVQDIAPGRSTAPEAADPLGKNLKPATIKMRSSATGNLLNITTSGISRLDVWVSPRLIDFKKKMEVRLNEKPLFRGLAKLELAPMLEDLRIRGDRQQIYYYKVTMGAPRPRGR